MIRTTKVRGHKRIQRKIKKWTASKKNINISDFLANQYDYVYLDIEPYCNISIGNTNFSEPKGKTRKDIIWGLEEIYNNWKIELDKLGIEYFLKIYLFESNISKSQVICSIGDKIGYYENYFRRIDVSKKILNFHKMLNSDFIWESYSDDFIYSEKELLTSIEYYAGKEDCNYSIRFLQKLKNSNYTKIEVNTDDGLDNLYYVPKGIVWIGGK
ncbi:hypothetical protein [Flavobacterium sp. DG2-3]|uniref:hypothetical protein n=1 Tax=Flavobacterium sp. DG2-3 TaxID=3068317 RepID=UPI00273FC83C|nr:hypothetical protein [Flavobacterium sp. DG2-3]MDP5201064.1 hypothetical protein [Flavobacterium sp. DG2-3]